MTDPQFFISELVVQLPGCDDVLIVTGSTSVPGQCVGFAEVSHLDGDFLWIDRIYVEPEFRHLGMASAMLRSIKWRAGSDGKDGICLGVAQESKQAIDWYEKLGFEKVYQYKEDDSYLYCWRPNGGA